MDSTYASVLVSLTRYRSCDLLMQTSCRILFGERPRRILTHYWMEEERICPPPWRTFFPIITHPLRTRLFFLAKPENVSLVDRTILLFSQHFNRTLFHTMPVMQMFTVSRNSCALSVSGHDCETVLPTFLNPNTAFLSRLKMQVVN